LAADLKTAKQKIKREKPEYFAVLVNLDLPESEGDDAVDYTLARNTPVLVYAATFNDEVRERMTSKRVLDYVVREDEFTLEYMVKTIERVHKNQSIKILVVDDSRVSRHQITRSLETQKFIVLEAENGIDALDMLKRHPDIMLVITDYKMPKMDGFELVSQIRKQKKSNKLAIIGISAYGSNLISVQFLKRGANDFIIKPFLVEELYLRVKQNVEMLEHIDAFQKLSNLDYLTQLYNRRFFFEVGNKIFENAKRRNLEITTALIDIDGFKAVNDTYGHEMGDLALKHMAQLLYDNFRAADIIARYGGEEFLILAINMDRMETQRVFDRIRMLIEQTPFKHKDGEISITVSIGVTTQIFDSLEETIRKADTLLYQAKQSGRNRVICD
ncbi:MAG: diguanylate cyclase, partial [Candidatus Aminicenantes bacterium]|nr:diguanylate cyclase [Candidatus Aminicenantes bacterium]